MRLYTSIRIWTSLWLNKYSSRQLTTKESRGWPSKEGSTAIPWKFMVKIPWVSRGRVRKREAWWRLISNFSCFDETMLYKPNNGNWPPDTKKGNAWAWFVLSIISISMEGMTANNAAELQEPPKIKRIPNYPMLLLTYSLDKLKSRVVIASLVTPTKTIGRRP